MTNWKELVLEALSSQAWSTAIDICSAQYAHTQDPTWLSPWGLALLQTESIDKALTHFQQATTLHPQDPALYHHLGHVYKRMGDFQEAEQAYRRALHYHPHYVAALSDLAQLYAQQGQLKEAIEWTRRALRTTPQNAALHYQLGHLWMRQDQFETAYSHYAAALAIDPDHIGALYHWGLLATARGEYQSAYTALQKAIPHLTDPADAWFHVGLCAQALDQPEEALSAYQQAYQHHPEHSRAAHNLGTLYLDKGEKNNALIWYTRALTHDPNNATAQHLIRALRGETVPAAPTAYLRDLFNHYADHYENHLQHLHYQTPALLRNLISGSVQNLPSPAQGLDIGCGPGTALPYFNDLALYWDGLDLAEQMVLRARQLGSYRKVYHDTFFDFTQRANIPQYDLLVACDVFLYQGDLLPVWSACHAILRTGGWILASFEGDETTPYPYILQTNGRYAHHPDYIRETLAKYHFDVQILSPGILRQQAHEPVTGWLLWGIVG